MKRLLLTIALPVILMTATQTASAQVEIGHFAPGVYGIRDFILPDTGFYGALYTYGYSTKRLNNKDGDKVETGPGGLLNLDVDVSAFALAPTFIWSSKFKILGARYGAYITPAFANMSVGAALSTEGGSGKSADESQFGPADLYLQPVWLNWTKTHFDFVFAYGFYAPVGKYKTETVTVPVIGPVTAEAADNIGYGYWTNQFQGAASWYPWTDKRMSVAAALTYEIHGNKEHYDLTPGQDLSLNWGVSQYLPLNKDMTVLLEIGPAGYISNQVSDDTGEDAADDPVRDEVGAVGGQLGVTWVKCSAALNFHYFYEYYAKDRFQGESIGLNFAIKF